MDPLESGITLSEMPSAPLARHPYESLIRTYEIHSNSLELLPVIRYDWVLLFQRRLYFVSIAARVGRIRRTLLCVRAVRPEVLRSGDKTKSRFVPLRRIFSSFR